MMSGFRNKVGYASGMLGFRSGRARVLCATLPKPGPRTAYTELMARGWESKSVEAQQEEARQLPAEKRRPLTQAEAAKQRELEGLKLSQHRIAQELAAARDARRRSMLENALHDMQQKISSFDEGGSG